MCIVVDADNFSKFSKRDTDMQPVWHWLNRGNGKIAYSNVKKIKDEWAKANSLVIELNRAGKFKMVPAQDVQEKLDELKGQIKSNDPHIIALALAAEVEVLISGDKTLHEDFKNLVGGKVYQTKSHSRLLRKDTCP